MSPEAVALVLASALAHASWNLLAKRARDPLAFLWGAFALSALLFAPFGLWAGIAHPPRPAGWGVLCVSVAVEVAYLWALGKAYRVGDLSVVYPVARGTSPLVAALLGVGVLGERVSTGAGAGIGAIVAGIFAASLRWSRSAARPPLHGTGFAVLAGVCTGTYSSIDKVGVGLVWPPLYGYLIYLGTAIGASGFLLASGMRAGAVRAEWRWNRGAMLAAGALGPLAYGMVVIALSFTPVSYVAAAREVSIALSVLLGAVVLREPLVLGRVAGVGLIGVGLYLLATG